MIHVHSQFSHDSEADLDEILSAARGTGADFVYVTYHSTLEALPWEGMYDGVLVLVGVEMSRDEGHMLRLGPRDVSARYVPDRSVPTGG